MHAFCLAGVLPRMERALLKGAIGFTNEERLPLHVPASLLARLEGWVRTGRFQRALSENRGICESVNREAAVSVMGVFLTEN